MPTTQSGMKLFLNCFLTDVYRGQGSSDWLQEKLPPHSSPPLSIYLRDSLCGELVPATRHDRGGETKFCKRRPSSAGRHSPHEQAMSSSGATS